MILTIAHMLQNTSGKLSPIVLIDGLVTCIHSINQGNGV